MRNLMRGGLVLVAVVALFPAASEAQLFGRRANKHCCCNKCQLPVAQCGCPAAPQTAYQPVIETQYAQQPVVTQRDIVETQYRTEPVTETVPATAYENVAVDEGGYQSVWVSKIVTKQVARTTYQQRTSYRSVPYQVTRRVAEVSTQTVPLQSVRYVPTTTNAFAYSGGSGVGMASLPYTGPTVASTYPSGTINPYPYLPQVAALPSYAPLPYAAAPYSTATLPPTRYAPTPIIASSPTPIASSSPGPVPDPRFSQAATPISPRMASRDNALDGYNVVPDSQPDQRQAGNGPLFVPAPSAAAVWRTPRGTITR